MRYQGKINNWKDDQGYGFITPNGGGRQVFVHIKSFSNRRRPAGDEMVTYELKADARGRARAENVAFVGARSPRPVARGRGAVSLTLAAIFLAFVAASSFAGKLPFAVLLTYLGASAVAFLAYALDKSAARNNRWRTPESTLHMFGLIGGWPGALAAQQLLRHKSKKTSFRIVFWATVLANCAALGWLFAPSGTGVLRSILGPA